MGGLAITRALRRPARALAAAVLAATLCAVAYATAADTVPPKFTDVPPCHIDPVAETAASTTVECKRPTVTGSATLTVELPQAITASSGTHTLEWKNGAATEPTATFLSLPVGTHLATWTATDSTGNASTTTQVIVVQDTTPPALALSKGFRPPAIEATATNTRIADSAAEAGVSTDPGITLTTVPETLPVPEPLSVPRLPRPETVTWRAEDAAGNVATVDTRILIKDEMDPTITCGRTRAIEPTTQHTRLADFAAQVGTSAVDHKFVDPSPVLTTEPLTMVPGKRPMSVIWTATDKSGNDDTCTQRIWIRDTMSPIISPDPLPDVTIEATGETTAITAALAGVTVTDYKMVDPNPALTPDKKTLAVGGPHDVTWTAEDASGNPSSKVQSITVAKFGVDSLDFTDNGIDITFTTPINPSTTGGILINKWELARDFDIGAQGMLSTITVQEGNTKVRVVPQLGTIGSDNIFCTPHRTTPNHCVSGHLHGPWILTLPTTLTSAQGSTLYAGTTPTIRSCVVHVTAHPYWSNHRGVADIPGCVGYVNVPSNPPGYTGPYDVIWSEPAPGSSSQAERPQRLPPQLSASLRAGTDSVMLEWERGSLPTATYAVERSVDGGAFAPAQVTVINATRATATITASDLGSSLSYRVAETLNGVTARLDPVTVTLPSSLEAPSGLGATRSASGSSIELDWRDAPIASGYHVEKAGTGGAFERIATVTESGHTVELGAPATGTHEFRVVAHLGSATSPPSATASVTLPPP